MCGCFWFLLCIIVVSVVVVFLVAVAVARVIVVAIDGGGCYACDVGGGDDGHVSDGDVGEWFFLMLLVFVC